jgi:hypothetical protein
VEAFRSCPFPAATVDLIIMEVIFKDSFFSGW